MKLFMRQKFFSWKDKFFVKDEDGKDVYYIEGEVFSLGKKLHIYDMKKNEVAFLHQKILSILPHYFIDVGGQEVAEIIKEFSLLRSKYRISGSDWEISGDFLSHDYRFFSKAKEIAYVHKAWMSWGDSFEIDISEEKNTLMVLCAVLAIDAVLDAESSAAANAVN